MSENSERIKESKLVKDSFHQMYGSWLDTNQQKDTLIKEEKNM